MLEWPHERRNRANSSVRIQQRLRDVPPEFINDIKGTTAFTELVQALADAFSKRATPQEKLAELSATTGQPETFGAFDETARHIVLALAAVMVLAKNATREMWEYLWSLARHSAPLASYLPQAVIAEASDAVFKAQFLALAHSVVTEAASNPGRRASNREKPLATNMREIWHEHPELSSLWRGSFTHSADAVSHDDDHVLSIVADIDMAEFIRLIVIYDYPEPVIHALRWAGCSWRFERWKEAVSVAPPAFGDQAEWNRSLILPLLLEIARAQFQFNLSRSPTPDQVAEATKDIKILATEIARTVAARTDAAGCVMRWGNWLVRTMISAVSSNQVPHPTDAASQGFIDSTLLDALIDELPKDRWTPVPTFDLEYWEPWCKFALGTLIALADKDVMPPPGPFLGEWKLSPDDWPAERGRTLQLHATPFEGTALRADGYGARVIAIPMLNVKCPENLWREFWESTAILREIVEFGDSDDTDEDGWRGRTDAADLLMLQFSIGLMIMDHLIIPPRPLDYDRAPVIENLLRYLDDAVHEMSAIDQLNGKYWLEASRHLAIRRAKWLSNPITQGGVVLGAEVKPTLADFLCSLAGDTENLLYMVYVAQQNGVDREVISAAFQEAGIDLGAETMIADRLLAVSPRTIELSESQLNAIRNMQ